MAAVNTADGRTRCCSKQWCSDVIITTDSGDETFGWLLLRFGRGPFIIVGGLFIGPVILKLAEAAGEANGDGKVMGGSVNASSVLVTFATIGGAIAAVMAPIIGAVCDYTRHRKRLLCVTQCLMCTFVGLCAMIGPATWLACTVLLTMAGLMFEFSSTAETAYLPELAADARGTTKLTAQAIALIHSSELATAVAVLAGAAALKMSEVGRAQFGSAFGGGASLLISLYCLAKLRPRAAAQRLPDSARGSIIRGGYKVLARTAKGILREYPQTWRFLLGHCFFAAGTNAVITISTTYMIEFLDFSGNDVAAAIAFALLMGLPGAAFANWLGKKMDIQKVTLVTLAVWMVSTGVAPWVMKRGAPFGVALVFAGVWGMGFGMVFTAPKTLFVMMIPGAREAEFIGIYNFCGKVLAWLPPLVFTIINEATDGKKLDIAFASLFLFYLVGFLFVCSVDYGAAREKVRPTLSRRRMSGSNAAELGIPVGGVKLDGDGAGDGSSGEAASKKATSPSAVAPSSASEGEGGGGGGRVASTRSISNVEMQVVTT